MRSDAGTLANAGGGKDELVVVILLVGVGVYAGVVADYRWRTMTPSSMLRL